MVRRLLVLLVLASISVPHLAAHPLMAGVAAHGENSWLNPALRATRRSATTKGLSYTQTLAIPLGTLALAVFPDRSPLPPLIESDWSQIDLMKTLFQARYSTVYVLNPPPGPETVRMDIASGSVRLTGFGAGSLATTNLSTTGGWSPTIDFAFVPLLRFASAGSEVELGVASSAGFPRLVSGEWPEATPPGEEISPDQRYAVEAQSFADLSAAVNWRLVSEREIGLGRTVRSALRLYVPLSLLHVNGSARLTLATDSDALPTSIEYEWALRGWTPGKGAGIGGRVDAGFALLDGAWIYGIGIAGLYNAFAGTGTDLAGHSDTIVLRYPWQAPIPSITIQHRSRSRGGSVRNAGIEILYLRGPIVRAGARFERGAVSVLAGVGWDQSVYGSAGIGVRARSWRVDVGLRTLALPVGGRTQSLPPLGLGLSVSRIYANER